jgi:hypothetical protein
MSVGNHFFCRFQFLFKPRNLCLQLCYFRILEGCTYLLNSRVVFDNPSPLVFSWLPGINFPSWQASVPVETPSPKTGAPLEGYRGRCDRSRCKCSHLLFTRPLPSHSIYYFCRFATRGLFSGGIPQNPVAATAKTNGCSVAVVTGVTQEPPHALHSLPDSE